MKLALIRRHFSPSGGAELYLQRLLGALAAAGHELHLYTELWSEPPEGVHVHPVKIAATRATRPTRFAATVEALLRHTPFDCVFSLERTLHQDVYRAGDGLHRVWLERRRQSAPWWRKPWTGRGAFHRAMLALEQQTFNPDNTRHIIVNSSMVRNEILQHFPFPADRIHLIRNGVDLDRLRTGRRDATRDRLGLQPSDFVLLFVGSGWERKGLPHLLRAFRALSGDRVRLLVVGKGRPPAPAPPHVQFVGTTDRVEDFYAAADLFVFLPLYEPCANVCCEALAAGLPVITTRQNGAAELLQPGVTGSVIEHAADTAGVLEAIRFWRDREPRTPVHAMTDLSLERNVRETVAILETAAQERAR